MPGALGGRGRAVGGGPRVLVDATAVPEDRGGVGRYVDQLLPALVELGADLAVVCQRRDEPFYRELLPGARVVTAPERIQRRPARLAWEQMGLPRVAREVGAEVIHCPHYTMPLVAGLPVVTTLHDATFFTHPEVHQRVKRMFFRAWTTVSLRRARRCVVPSQATLDELARVTRGVHGQVQVAHHGVDAARFHVPTEGELGAARRHLGLRAHRYVGFLGTIEPRKNVPALIEGWQQAVADLPDPPALVLAGGRGWDERVDEVLARVSGRSTSSCSPASSAARRCSPTPAWPRASGSRCWRPWRAARRCSPPARWHSRRWVATPLPTPSRTPERSPIGCGSSSPPPSSARSCRRPR